MEKIFITLGQWGEVQVDMMQVTLVEAVAELDRAGQAMLPPTYETPTFAGSSILLNNGQRVTVPQSVDEVMQAMVDAQNQALRP